MTKPLNEFGGWLRFFEVCCWLSQAASVVVGPLLLWFLATESGLPARLENLSLLGDLVVRFYFVRLILKTVRVPTPASADRVRRALGIILFASVGFLAFDFALAMWKHGWAWSKDAETALREGKSAVAWPGIWFAYFSSAKRVKAFYSQPEPAPAASAGPAPLEPT